MTYSIIGRDPESGQIGAILQSFYYGCGPRTMVAVPGKGIVVMQMVPEMTYGDEGVAAMGEGSAPGTILDRLTSNDLGQAMRQVTMMNCAGEVAAYTGDGCIPSSGHRIGTNCCAQGAMVESEAVWVSMVEVFEASSGPLEARLMDAMRAGEREGGDIRGPRAAAMLVVSLGPEASWVVAHPVNIRVDDSDDPLGEVQRHVELQRSMNAIERAFERGIAGDVKGAIDDYAKLAESIPDDPDLTMRYAIMLARAGDLPSAREQLFRMTRVHAGWARVPERLVRSGLLPDALLLPEPSVHRTWGDTPA